MTPPRLQDATVAIVGLGLMGSSLGLALAGRCAHRIGTDAKAVNADRARELGAVDRLARDVASAVADADLVVLATPVGSIVRMLPEVAEHARPGAVVTDLGSTKVAVCKAFDDVDVASVAGHPMCGREVSGPTAAEATLFEGATWVLCPTSGSEPEAVDLVRELVRTSGAHAVRMDAQVHDRAVAVASHLPYVVAQTLVKVLETADADGAGEASLLASTGFSSATRLASGSVPMWRDILATNHVNVRNAIGLLRDALTDIEQQLDDRDALDARLDHGRATRATLLGS